MLFSAQYLFSWLRQLKVETKQVRYNKINVRLTRTLGPGLPSSPRSPGAPMGPGGPWKVTDKHAQHQHASCNILLYCSNSRVASSGQAMDEHDRVNMHY